MPYSHDDMIELSKESRKWELRLTASSPESGTLQPLRRAFSLSASIPSRSYKYLNIYSSPRNKVHNLFNIRTKMLNRSQN
jgi:hypothetical protein